MALTESEGLDFKYYTKAGIFNVFLDQVTEKSQSIYE